MGKKKPQAARTAAKSPAAKLSPKRGRPTRRAPLESVPEMPPKRAASKGDHAPIEFDATLEGVAALRGEREMERDLSESPLAAAEGAMLDAWYGSFPPTEAVIGATDERQLVADPSAVPWRSVCSLVITDKTGKGWIGTGWLYSPRLVVTAGHCVYMQRRGGFVASIEVIPGRNRNVRPYGAWTARKFATVAAWANRGDTEFDYGAIFLPSAVGSSVEPFPVENRSDAKLRDFILNVAGYPSDKESGTQWFASDAVGGLTPRQISYALDTFSGMSGMPVWIRENGVRTVVGIHTSGDTSANFATRINDDVLGNLDRWKASS
jgi:V8-like Glu-specific endopeptidase